MPKNYVFQTSQQCIRQTSNKVFNESKATNRHRALALSQKNILKQGRIFFMLVFFVVSGEKRITKQLFLVLYGYLFPEKVSVFENLRKALESSIPT